MKKTDIIYPTKSQIEIEQSIKNMIEIAKKKGHLEGSSTPHILHSVINQSK
ncbi:MAG: hypothetical protein QW478_09450 [Candidatus Micrarchaeaceae archaeon]